jgi:hypothetical protein
VAGKEYYKKYCGIYCSCDDEENIFVAGFIFSKCIRSIIIIFKPIDMSLLKQII